jgi:HlyD family secretion protein
VIVVQDVGNLYVEANISEANIAQVQVGQEVTYTFDAIGSDKQFTGKVTAIDPASTVVSGVVNYKVTASVDQVSDVKPGMTANMSVLVGKRAGALTVPQRALVVKGNKQYVRVITDPAKQVYVEREVSTGLEADGGVVEIVKGLSAGETVVTFVEEKK